MNDDPFSVARALSEWEAEEGKRLSARKRELLRKAAEMLHNMHTMLSGEEKDPPIPD